MKLLALISNVFLTISIYSQNELILQKINSENKPWTDTVINDSEQKFTFAVVTDRTGGHREGIWQKGVEKLNLMQPAFVVSVGDLIEGYTENKKQINQQWNEFNEMVNQLEMPFFYVAGNHDYSNEIMENEWFERYGTDHYHFLYNDVLVIWLKIESLLKNRKHSVFTGHHHKYTLYERNRNDYFVLSTMGGGSELRGKEYGEFDHFLFITMTKKGPRFANLMLDGIEDKNVLKSE